jgi:hypothetical protein
MSISENPLGIIRGVADIAAFLCMPPRRAYHLLQTGQLPAVKEGQIWVTTLDLLRGYYKTTGVAQDSDCPNLSGQRDANAPGLARSPTSR